MEANIDHQVFNQSRPGKKEQIIGLVCIVWMIVPVILIPTEEKNVNEFMQIQFELKLNQFINVKQF